MCVHPYLPHAHRQHTYSGTVGAPKEEVIARQGEQVGGVLQDCEHAYRGVRGTGAGAEPWMSEGEGGEGRGGACMEASKTT